MASEITRVLGHLAFFFFNLRERGPRRDLAAPFGIESTMRISIANDDGLLATLHWSEIGLPPGDEVARLQRGSRRDLAAACDNCRPCAARSP